MNKRLFHEPGQASTHPNSHSQNDQPGVPSHSPQDHSQNAKGGTDCEEPKPPVERAGAPVKDLTLTTWFA